MIKCTPSLPAGRCRPSHHQRPSDARPRLPTLTLIILSHSSLGTSDGREKSGYSQWPEKVGDLKMYGAPNVNSGLKRDAAFLKSQIHSNTLPVKKYIIINESSNTPALKHYNTNKQNKTKQSKAKQNKQSKAKHTNIFRPKPFLSFLPPSQPWPRSHHRKESPHCPRRRWSGQDWPAMISELWCKQKAAALKNPKGLRFFKNFFCSFAG